ncbi:hypothetical protein [Methylobacterium sp. SyP6R]|uniref:hypothetical protein n=1 Tax=Methylobacterium sp. SyP6R TaxID=2718876 RepID=UPI001F3E0FB3|nr:hypothetical protein [Methylobacterium sp. SyP6R]MCF4129006.1 hypothetical protein [Methylobacterium sp. SyP6R]
MALTQADEFKAAGFNVYLIDMGTEPVTTNGMSRVFSASISPNVRTAGAWALQVVFRGTDSPVAPCPRRRHSLSSPPESLSTLSPEHRPRISN